MKQLVALAFGIGVVACGSPQPIAVQPAPSPMPEVPVAVAPPAPIAPAPPRYDRIARVDFNRWAVHLNLPVYWIADGNHDNAIEPDEVAALLFYPTATAWVAAGAFTPAFATAYDQIVVASQAPPPTGPDAKRRELVGRDLDQGRPTLVRTDATAFGADDRAFVDHMLNVAKLIDDLYAIQNGTAALASHVPADDAASQSLFRRNRGPRCVGPATEKDPLCSAIHGSPQPKVDVYPFPSTDYVLQADSKFCEALEKRKDADKLLGPFTVVRGSGDKPEAVPYNVAYQPQVTVIAAELIAAADSMKDPAETPLVTYLRAAAAGFTSNDWNPADEAWAKMTVDNSKWYVRVAPDEVYWEPCAHKAGFHLTFARINQGSIEWQKKLVPVQQDMEAAIAARAGAPYKARKVTFHLPDFIDIIVNAGDDRTPLGATIGQSLPNFGPVANGGRGRTVAMVNLYGDPDSHAARRAQAESVLDAASAAAYVDDSAPGFLSTILHEATHNLGPAHQYKVKGKDAEGVFGGPLASVFEELKAQTGALFLIEFLRAKGLISDSLALQTYTDSIVWAFGHISQGMYTGSGERKTYSNLAAIQIGFLIDHGALTWDATAKAANGTDTGAFTVHHDKLLPAIDELMKVVAGIKARGDVAAGTALVKKYVDGPTVPMAMIAERFLRFPKASFVYSVTTAR